ncbi:MAG: hypothetical protein P8J87_21655, partial [Verrucomicrobiales bacterium]|nr:hypothetical protein [Verrucomicrobiales bacterium]
MRMGLAMISKLSRWVGVAGLVMGVPGIVGAQAVEEKQPAPIKVQRKGGKALIPEVERDAVIGFALYTVQDGVMKMGVQLYPLKEGEERKVTLERQVEGSWERVVAAPVDEVGWHAELRAEGWDHSKDFPYRVTHAGGAVYEGLIRKDPVDKAEIVVAAFTGNSNGDRTPRTDIVENIKRQDPDLLFLSGDQSYDHRAHTAAWLLFGRQFGEITKDRPTVTIPDDHDVGQGNLWGEGGKISKLGGGADGGYTMPADYVRMVERAQTWHLPDAYDPTPIEQGIGVYYTSLNVGGIDFAIVEDRKFKTGPAGLIPKMGPRPDHINDPSYDRSTVDVPEAVLLGERQLEFLWEWGQDWGGAEMKAVLSQTIFAGGAHLHGKHDGRLLADLDSNGWPQAGRAKAVHEMRRFFGFHIAGDQHLATVISHGTQQWEDSNWSFCVPSIVNYYGRWWWPLEEPQAGGPEMSGALRFQGRFYDGLGNKLTMHAYANPTPDNFNAAGHGIVRFNKANRSITMECWPRHQDVTATGAKQHPGWPVQIAQMENYGRKAMAYLPMLATVETDPVVQVIDEYSGEIVYTVRIKGNSFRPKVFREAVYTIRVGEGDAVQEVTGVASVGEGDESVLEF